MLKKEGKLKKEHEEPYLGPFSFYIECYFELGTCRYEYGSPIPFTSIVEFVKIYGIEDFYKFHYYIRILDNLYMDKCKQESERNNGN